MTRSFADRNLKNVTKDSTPRSDQGGTAHVQRESRPSDAVDDGTGKHPDRAVAQVESRLEAQQHPPYNSIKNEKLFLSMNAIASKLDYAKWRKFQS